MAITNLYPNLPGHLVEFKDGGLQLTVDKEVPSTTKSLLILGTAIDGPINEPVKIDATTVSQLYGSDVTEEGYPNGATLTKYAKQAFKNGFYDVRCMRVTGTQATSKAFAINEVRQGTKRDDVLSVPVNSLIPGAECTVIAGDETKTGVLTPNGSGGVQVKLENIPYTSKFTIKGTDTTVQTSTGEPLSDGNTNVNVSIDTNVYNTFSTMSLECTTNTCNLSEIMDNVTFKVANVSAEGNDLDSFKGNFVVNPEGYTAQYMYKIHNETSFEDIVYAPSGTNSAVDVMLAMTAIQKLTNGASYMITSGDGQINVNVKFKVNYKTTTEDNKTVDVWKYTNILGFNNGTGSATSSHYGKITISLEDIYEAIYPGTTETDANEPNNKITAITGISVGNEDIEYNITSATCIISEPVGSNTPTTTDIKITFGNGTINVPGCTDVADIVDISVDKSTGAYELQQATGDYTATLEGSSVVINLGTDAKATLVPGDVIRITYKNNNTIEEVDAYWFISNYGGEVYNDASIEVKKLVNLTTGQVVTNTDKYGNPYCELQFIFHKPDAKLYSESDKPFFLTSVDCPTVADLRAALKNYNLNNVFDVITTNENMFVAQSIRPVDIPTSASIEKIKAESATAEYGAVVNTSTNPATVTGAFADGATYTLSGGSNGIGVSADDMFCALSGVRDSQGYLLKQGAYQILENYHVDYIYPAGVYADMEQTVNPHSDFHRELALLCAVLTYRTKMTHGFIDVRPNSNTTLVGIQNYVAKLAARDNLYYMIDENGNVITDSQNNKMDIGWYTSVVVGPEPVMTSDTLGTYYGSPAIAYAALNSSLKPESAPTNKPLPGVNGMKYKFSNKQMDTLVGKRMVVFKTKGDGTATASSTPYVVDGCTAGSPDCDYRRIATVKVVTDVVDQIREVADPFIGEPNTVEQRNALSALISKRLSYLLTQGEIQYYAFEINATIQQVLLGECTIALTLIVPQELRKITTVVALRATA